MLKCEYCNGVINAGQTECPHCGSSLLDNKNEQLEDTHDKTKIHFVPLNFSPIYKRDLIFWQNAAVVIICGFILSNFYVQVVLIPVSLNIHKIGIILCMIIFLLSYVLTFYLAILTILGIYKSNIKKTRYTINETTIYSLNGNGVNGTYPISGVENIKIEQSPKQVKYHLGTLLIKIASTGNQPPHTLKLKNIEQPDVICTKILELRDRGKLHQP